MNISMTIPSCNHCETNDGCPKTRDTLDNHIPNFVDVTHVD